MSVHEAVLAALAGRDDWRARAALALASSVDAGTGGASATKELRSLMTELGAEAPVVSGLDDLKKRREKRGA